MSYTSFPDSLIDSNEHDAYELAACLVVARKTIGWGKTSDGISLSQFMKALKVSKPTAIKIIKSLIAKNIITKSPSFLDSGGQSYNNYSFTQSLIDEVNNKRMPQDEGEGKPSLQGGKGDLQEGKPDLQGSDDLPPEEVNEVDRGSKEDLQGAVNEVDTQKKPITKPTNTEIKTTAPTGLEKFREKKFKFADPTYFDGEWIEEELFKSILREKLAEKGLPNGKSYFDHISGSFVDYWCNGKLTPRHKKKDWGMTWRNHVTKELATHAWRWKKERNDRRKGGPENRKDFSHDKNRKSKISVPAGYLED